MRQYRLNVRVREKKFSKMTPTFMICMKRWDSGAVF